MNVKRVLLNSSKSIQHKKAESAPAPVATDRPTRPVSKLLSKRQLAELLSVNVWTVDRWRHIDPTFPAPIWISNTTPRWLRTDIEAWLAMRPRGGIAPDRRGKAAELERDVDA